MNSAKDIFLDALDLPDVEQPAFVAAQCDGDVALLKAVSDLLAAERSARFIDRATAALGPSWVAENPGPRGKIEQPGDHIGRYQLVRPLGEGGFGAVFLAEQQEPVTRNVALKILKLGMNTEEIVRRFEGERQTLALMDHPNIARVFDAGATEGGGSGGRPYFVMEYVDGLTITEYCTKHRVPVRERLRLMEQVCLAVQHAHQRGIIHRDLKPGNILVAQVDDKPEPKVIDFGIAKAASPDNALLPSLTMEMQIVGTPQYMSPEQATAGSANPASIDTRSDVYSLGTVLYELMTGLPPFSPLLLRHAGLEKICQIIREQTPAKPSTRIADSRVTDPKSIDIGLPADTRGIAGEIDWIVMKALEKEPARRYQSAAELAADIRRHLEDRAVLAGPPSRLYQLKKFARRHRPTIAAAGLVLATLVGATVVSAVMAARARGAEAVATAQRQAAVDNEHKASENEQKAVASAEQARKNEYRANAELAKALSIAAFAHDLLTGIGPSVAKGRDTVLLRELLDNSIKFADDELSRTPMPNLIVRGMIAEALSALGDDKKALEQLEPPWNNVPPELQPERDRLDVTNVLATLYFNEARSPEADPIYERVVKAYEAIGDPGHYQAQSARLSRAQILARRGKFDQAEPIFRDALKQFEASGALDTGMAISTANSLAAMLAASGHNDEAIRIYRELIDRQRRKDGPDSTMALLTLNNLAGVLSDTGNREEAVKAYQEVLDTQRRLYPPNHPDVLKTMNNFSALLIRMQRLDEAEALLKAPFETWHPLLKDDDGNAMAVQQQMIALRRKQRRPDEAAVLSQELIDAFARACGPEDPRTLAIYPMLFASLAEGNHPAEGLAIVNKMEAAGLRDKMAKPQRDSFDAAAGLLFFKAGDMDEARRRAAASQALAAVDADKRLSVSIYLVELKGWLGEKIEPTVIPGPATGPTTKP